MGIPSIHEELHVTLPHHEGLGQPEVGTEVQPTQEIDAKPHNSG